MGDKVFTDTPSTTTNGGVIDIVKNERFSRV